MGVSSFEKRGMRGRACIEGDPKGKEMASA